MALDLVSYLAAGGETPRLWINFNDYTKKLLLGKDENPWTNPAAYMSFYRQAHGLVKAQVVVIDVWDLFQHWIREAVFFMKIFIKIMFFNEFWDLFLYDYFLKFKFF